ncbi:hypothetical protein Tco_1307518, partial [Tanacetum coccineum]
EVKERYLVIWFLLYLQPCRSTVFAALQVYSIVNDSLGVTRMLIVIVQREGYGGEALSPLRRGLATWLATIPSMLATCKILATSPVLR